MNPKDQKFFRKLRIAILLFIGVHIFGVIGFMLVEHYTFSEAFYMTMIIVSTVGLGAVRELSPEGRVFVGVMILIGLVIATYAFSFISSYIMEGNLQYYLKFRKVKTKIDHLQDHIIVCGYGRNGKQACEQLKMHNRPFVVVETKNAIVDALRIDEQLLFVEGDATKDEVLIAAGINHAKALITTLPNDADNVFVVLTARGLNSNLKIISRASEDSSFVKIKRAGADNVIMPDKIGGTHMASLIANPDVLEFIDVITGKANFDLEEISFANCSPAVVGKKLTEIITPDQDSANIIGLKKSDGSYIINPPGQTVITSDTKIFVLGTTEQVNKLRRTLA